VVIDLRPIVAQADLQGGPLPQCIPNRC
jgi:hypothetical protein